ncbi:WD repeat-containing protein 31-like [Gigantopelta aegis]|uniref:WD repeat-containing protein 31-like n=1 Tax=Gigantopelta aegis TaxID=1735272 RepID=UPI001B88C140|nr:WD repeat-containing protein 31-like [Gigantopelta aegis]
MGKLFSKSKHKREKSDQYSSRSAQPEQDILTGMAKNPVHQDAVVSLAPVQPGLCLSGSKDKTVVLYDYHNSRIEDRWSGHEREITKVKFGAACNGIFSASRDKSVKMWHRGNAHPVRDFLGHDLVVTAIDLNGDNTRLCTGSRDNTVRLFDIESGSCLLENNIPQNLITDIKWIPNSDLAIQVGEDKDVRLFDMRNLNVVHTFTKKQYIQMCCDISSDGNFCLTCSNGFGGNGCEATLWDLRSRRLLHEFKGHTEAIESCLFLPNSDEPLVATASRDCSVKVWNRDTKALITDLVLSGAGPLTSLLAYEDSSILVGSFNLGVIVLDLKNGKLKQTNQF